MTATAFVLVLLSAILHTAWNYASKRTGSTLAVFAWANLFAAFLLLPVAAIYFDLFPRFPAPVWRIVVLTGFFQIVYFAGLARAYQEGDLSLAYPLSRSLPVLMVPFITILFGLQERLPAGALAGMALVAAGCLLLPLENLREWSPSRYLDRACLFAALAAAGTAGYSVADSEGLRLLREGVQGIRDWELTLCYLFFEAAATAVWLAAYAAFQSPRAFSEAFRNRRSVAAFIGISSYVTYGLVLWAMHHASNVSYVVALRQLSILLGVVVGVVALKELPSKPRLLGAAIAFIGLILVTAPGWRP